MYRSFPSKSLKTIFVDVDSVLADIVPAWLAFYNEEYGDVLKPEDMKHWNFSDYTKDPEAFLGYLKRPDFYDNVKPIAGSFENVKKLAMRGYRIVYATASAYNGIWLYRYGYNVFGDIMIAKDKSVLRGDCLVDDRLLNVVDFHGFSILFKQPWNTHYGFPVVAHGWNDVYNLILNRFEKEE